MPRRRLHDAGVRNPYNRLMVESSTFVEPAGGVVPARYWSRLEDGRLQCNLCPRACRLHHGQRGLCFVRGRQGDELVIRYAYTGNVHDREGGSTYCHSCGALLIGRDWFELTAWNVTGDGRCARCDTPCAGAFDGPPGRWGACRAPVRLSVLAR